MDITDEPYHTQIETMIDELSQLFSSAHYAKVNHEFIKHDSEKTWKATSIQSIPVHDADYRSKWIDKHKREYPLTFADMIARGAFVSSVPSCFPTVEVFRQTYLDPLYGIRHQAKHQLLWCVLGTPFSVFYPFSSASTESASSSTHVVYKKRWSRILLDYTPERIKQAKRECFARNPTWWHAFLATWYNPNPTI